MSLPLAWLDRIFDKLTLTYGQQFLRRWQDIDINDVKSDWGHELAGFVGHPKAIAWALQNLPERPPTVIEFRAIARKAPGEDEVRLEAPKADPGRIAVELAKLAPVRVAARSNGKDWARRIVQSHADGGNVAPLNLKFAREALGSHA